MVHRVRDQLAIINLQSGEERISFDRLEKVILDRPSNVIYCELDGKLHGIITMGDIGRTGDEWVTVNTEFTCLGQNECMRARWIFFEKVSINALPIVDDNGVLLGDWSRWNDLILEEQRYGGGGTLQRHSYRICSSVEYIE